MKHTLTLLALMGTLPALAQDADAEREPLTGTRILPRQVIVFDTAPIRLGGALNQASAGLTDTARPSVTFVLDQDLSVAAEVFRQHPGFATDQVVTGLDSLMAVRDHLAESDQGPYGLVNLVAHGSPQTGLDVPVTAGGASASAPVLAGLDGGHPALVGKLDGESLIRVYGCGVGVDPQLIDGLSRFFSPSQDQRPRLEALREFVAFSSGRKLSVTLLDGLTVISPSRMAARRAIERLAASQGTALPFEWLRDLETRPLEIWAPAGEGVTHGLRAARQSPLIRQELLRLDASLVDFSWAVEQGTVKGRALLAYLPLEPKAGRRFIHAADQADWIASR